MNNTTSNTMWKELCKNTCISISIFVLILFLSYIVQSVFNLPLLHFTDAAFCVGIPASIIGVGYVLTIRNPANYTGFYLGILMSVLLAVQFFLQGNYDLFVLYIVCFVPFQIKSIYTWKQSNNQQTTEPLQPGFLSTKNMLFSLLVFLLITLLDYLLATFVINQDTLHENIIIKLMGALLISSSILANFWLIYKKNDAWIYWVIYSLSGIIFYIIINNIFNMVLFLFFLVINSMAGIAWYKNTTPENKGWLQHS